MKIPLRNLVRWVAVAAVLGLNLTSCATAHQAVHKTEHVLQHGEEKMERHL